MKSKKDQPNKAVVLISKANKLGLSWAKLSRSWGLDVDWLE